MTNLDNDIKNKEPKKEKTIKHGILAMATLIIAVLLIVLGIYLYEQFFAPTEIKTPVKASQIE